MRFLYYYYYYHRYYNNNDNNNDINNYNSNDDNSNSNKETTYEKDTRNSTDIRIVESVRTSQKEIGEYVETGQQRELINISRKERFLIQPSAPISIKNSSIGKKSPRTPVCSVGSNVKKISNNNYYHH